jgi:hypothetical protein
MSIEINGMAHVILTVSRFEVAREFYRKLLPEFGMKPVFDGDRLFYCIGARTAIGRPCCTDRSFWRRGEDGIGGRARSNRGQSPCHSKRTKIAVIASRSSGTG